MKTVITGFGFMGMTHAATILGDSEMELVAIVDKHPGEIRKKLTGNLGNFSTGRLTEEALSALPVYADLGTCLTDLSPDACVIAVHTDMHFKLAKMALNAGVHVFLEKPFSLDPSECRQLIDLAHEKELILMIGHVVRFMPAYQKLQQWIASEKFGKLEYLSLSRFSGVPAWGEWKEKRKDFGSSGGALFDLVVHDIDFASWVLGPPADVKAVLLPGKLSHHDYVSAVWNYGQGPVVRIEGGNIFHTAYSFQASFAAKFAEKSVSYSSCFPGNIVVSDDAGQSLVPVGEANEGFAEEIRYFGNCARNGIRPEICTPESALQTIEICHRHITGR